jgi:hypothetical protein
MRYATIRGLAVLVSLMGCAARDPADEEPGQQSDAICQAPCGTSTILVSGVTPTSIALDASNVYFTDGPTSQIAKVPIAGGPRTTLLTQPIGQILTSLKHDGGALYWASAARPLLGGGVWSMPAAGGAASQLSHHGYDEPNAQALAIYHSGTSVLTNATHVLFGEPTVAALYDLRISLFGISEKSLLPAVDPAPPHLDYYAYAIALDASNVYFTHDTDKQIWKAPRAGGTGVKIISGAEREVLAINDSTLYFQKGSDLVSASTSGSGLSTFEANVGTVSALAVHGGYLYWACSNCGTIKRKSLTGATAFTMASSVGTPISLAVNDQYVFFGTTSALRRVPN